MHVLLALVLAAPATAATLDIDKKGIYPNFVWVDGVSHGKVKNKKGLHVTVEPGTHEIWVAYEPNGVVTHCHGLVEVPESKATVELSVQGCTGISEGIGEKTLFRGASVMFSDQSGEPHWVSVDGGRALAMGGVATELNLAPGKHTIVLHKDVMGEDVFDQGTFTLGEGERLPITCTSAGCTGWDEPPVIIVQQAPAPAAAPTVEVNVNVDLGGAVDGAMEAAASAPAPSGGSADMTCCINGAFYECPSAEATYDCSGAFMACMMDCGMMDMSCPDQCLQDPGMDPSGCSRASGRDGECEQ